MSPFGRPRLVGFGLLALIFVVGALVGAAVDRAVIDPAATAETRDGDREDEEDGDDGRSYIIDRVEMDAPQRAAIDSILERRADRMRDVWREVEPRLDAITDSARAEIMEVLTPQQRAEYEAMLERRRQQRRDRGDSDDRSSAADPHPATPGNKRQAE